MSKVKIHLFLAMVQISENERLLISDFFCKRFQLDTYTPGQAHLQIWLCQLPSENCQLACPGLYLVLYFSVCFEMHFFSVSTSFPLPAPRLFLIDVFPITDSVTADGLAIAHSRESSVVSGIFSMSPKCNNR